MSETNWNAIGNQMRDAVEESLRTGDFRPLNEAVSGTVSTAISEAKRQMEQGKAQSASGQQNQGSGRYENNRQSGGYQGTGADVWNQAGKSTSRGSYQNGNSGNSASRNAGSRNADSGNTGTARTGTGSGQTGAGTGAGQAAGKMKQVGSVAGTVYLVLGGVGALTMGLIFFLLLVALIVGGDMGVFRSLAVITILFAACIAMIEKGCLNKERLKRASRYVELCGGRTYINVEDLALHTGKTKKYLRKDLKKMLRLGIFPEGHLDEEEACFMLDDATYRQYLDLRRQRKARELEEKNAAESEKAGRKSRKEEQKGAAKVTQEAENPELEAMMQEGQDCIRRLRDMNDNIEGEVISAKLFTLENLLKEIFDAVKEHPEQMPMMHKFMDYYLPTTLKLVEAYEEFDNVSVPGEDILTAKQEIEKTLDTINQAFVELLNKMYRASVYDVTTDAQVLQTMLAKEGLTKDDAFDKVAR